MTKSDFRWALLAPTDPLAVFKGGLLLRAEERNGEKEREGEGKRKVVERGRDNRSTAIHSRSAKGKKMGE